MMHAEVWGVISDLEDDWEPGAEERGQPLEAGKGKEMDFYLESSGGTWPLLTPWFEPSEIQFGFLVSNAVKE